MRLNIMAHSSLAHSLTDPHILTCDYFWWPCSFICKIKGLNEISQHPCLDNPSGLWLELFQWKMMMMMLSKKKKKSSLSLSLSLSIYRSLKEKKIVEGMKNSSKESSQFEKGQMYLSCCTSMCINWTTTRKIT